MTCTFWGGGISAQRKKLIYYIVAIVIIPHIYSTYTLSLIIANNYLLNLLTNKN